MKYKMIKKASTIVITMTVLMITLSGCSKANREEVSINETDTPSINVETVAEATELEVRFGREGEPFTLNLYDNDTAKTIAKEVGNADWNLPIYHYDDYENYEVMQYYDIPSRYKIPSNPENITSAKAGEVYYSNPNRIVLFYQDAEIEGAYTKIGYFEYSNDFYNAVVNNPVVEGWSNKIISISKFK